ncbi:MAG: PRD domain-containing protein [Lactobacillus sp.]|nr:MAG: PRD domain-containing protein [Lactobacillus sp.]
MFPDIYSCVEKIQQYLADTYGWSCSNEELLYLMMHVNRLVTAR